MDRTARLQHIVSKAKGLPFYKDRLSAVDPASISADDVSTLPFVTRDELVEHFKAHPPHGGFLRDDVVQMHLTPAPGITRMPEYLTAQDIGWQAEAVAEGLRRCGLSNKDRCLVVFSYHMLAGGWLFHEGLTKLGAKVLALGPADASNVVDVADTYGFNVLVRQPELRAQNRRGGRAVRDASSGGRAFHGGAGLPGSTRVPPRL